MTDITDNAASRRLRKLADNMDSAASMNTLLDIANEVERLEGNLVYFGSILCANADETAESAKAPRYKLERHYSILGAVMQAMKGIPTWKHASEAKVTYGRAERYRDELAKRLKLVKP